MPQEDDLIERFQTLFNSLGPNVVPDLSGLYEDDVLFQDPFVRILGRQRLNDYLVGTYRNVITCRFEFDACIGAGDDRTLPWVMFLRHRKLAQGKMREVSGLSHLTLHGGRIGYHRDYYDAGQLLYENVPVLGTAVRLLRRYAV